MFKDYTEFWRWLIDTGKLTPPEEDDTFCICPYYMNKGEPEWLNYT
jgi:hypothetical protein